ncbi:MAG: ribonuclease H family protein [Bacteroidetes bacterium]|nr:ribonuclease H family protein [Bacteroidota bacterium]MCL2301961.1 ribonuclease H family protein [Lentimicrobiaceae bacterium]
MAKSKYYVVWQGRVCGVFNNWNDCKAQVDGFEGAKYKSFETKAEAEKAYTNGYKEYFKTRKAPVFTSGNAPILNSLSVDAACNMVTGQMEYQGVHTGTKELWFKQGPFPKASNNIGEFLALVHGLALLKQKNITIPIYSDSITAIAWVREKKHKSIVLPTEENEVIFDLLTRAELWLQNNSFKTPIIKWNTKQWGEIPADFGRK